MRKIIILYGPTASGKSQLAQVLAQDTGGVIINADAMQVYRELRILTARPTAEEEAALPHRLYGVMSAAEACSAGKWLALAKTAIEEAKGIPILVGGTGLYLKALMDGLSPIPDIDPEVRADATAKHAELGSAGFHALLESRDPVMASRLNPGDTQRVIRAYEVIEHTGMSLAEWQDIPRQPVLPDAEFDLRLMDVAREEIYRRCDARFLTMLDEGALEEVKALAAFGLPTALPATRAVGVPELMAHLNGQISLEEATAKAQQATRNYAKRQLTWGRNQFLGKLQ